MSSNKPVIVITSGDPAGIGPEIIRKAFSRGCLPKKFDYRVIGPEKNEIKPGTPSSQSGCIAFANIVKAVELLGGIKGRKALVTAPISKSALHMAGYKYSGHTELLSELNGSCPVTMMFNSGHFNVALVTRHISLSSVPGQLTVENIAAATLLFHDCLKNNFRIKNPKIAVCGLNPHAGEDGILGDEENRIIKPAVKLLEGKISNVSGPHPADVIFNHLYKGRINGVVAMYHDQGLVPFKMLYFDKGVNVTLGLPYIRTSPDHGTAYDIAGKGKADPDSMIEAIKLACKLA